MRKIEFQELGRIDYKKAWDYQEKIFSNTVERKLHNRKVGFDEQPTDNYFLFCEHPHVYTLGKSGDEAHLLLSEKKLKENHIDYYKINRGGDITYHGPGQIVGYPILDLDHFYSDIHRYLRELEEVIILTLADYGVKGDRYPGYTGVWIDPKDPFKARKICAMGVRCSRWVTMHGFAFNINADLSYFNDIIPCGITDKKVASLNKEIGKDVDVDEVKEKIKKYFTEVFEIDEVNSKYK